MPFEEFVKVFKNANENIRVLTSVQISTSSLRENLGILTKKRVYYHHWESQFW